MARYARRGDVPHRLELRAGVVLGDPDEKAGEQHADRRRAPQVPDGDASAFAPHVERHGTHHILHEKKRDGIERDQREHARDDEALVERRHDVDVAGLCLDEPGADDRGDDGEPADRERIDERRRGVRLHHQRAEKHGGDDGDGIGFEEVGRHAGAIAHVVADVVGDDRGVARVVLRDARLHLADEVGADVRALGENAAAETREDRDERGAEAQADERMDDVREVRLIDRVGVEQREVARDAEQPEPDDEQSGDRAAVERDLQRLVQADARGFRGAHVGAHRDVHADDAAGAGEHGADEKAPGGRPAQARHEADDQEEDHADDGDGLVLAPQIRDRAFAHRRGDLAHARVAIGQAQDPADLPDPVDDGENRAYQREHETALHLVFSP